jgi:hypothetical protein
MKKIALTLALALAVLTGCSEADTASRNVSKAADNFGVERRIVFFNGITDTYLLEIRGLCALGNYDDVGQLSVTCKTGRHSYKKHFLGLSDNVSYFVEQLRPASVSGFHYKVIFRPEAIVPDIDLATSRDQNLP